MSADIIGPLVERIAMALAEYDTDIRECRPYVEAAADLLRRAGIGEPAGLVWRGDEAETPFETYYRVYRDGTFSAAALTTSLGARRLIGNNFSSPEAARAACEADYAARLLAAGWVPADTSAHDGATISKGSIAADLAQVREAIAKQPLATRAALSGRFKVGEGQSDG